MRHFVVVLALILRSCLAGFIIEESTENKSNYLIGAAVKTLKSCYEGRTNGVCFAGNTDGIPFSIFLEQSIPVTLINNASRASGDDDVRRKSLYQLQIFVVAGSSASEITEILNEIKDSIWWNHLASFIILTWPTLSENDCSNAYGMLWAAWELGLLNAKLMCIHRSEGAMIYGFNPFTDKAPRPWKLEKTGKGKNDHPWTMFAMRFQEDDRICEQFDFRKENDLGGYEMRSGVLPAPGYWSIDMNKTGTDRFGGAFGNLAKILCRTLNATCTIQIHNLTTYMVPKVFNRISDIFLFPRSQLSTINVTTTYPHWQSGLGIVTRFNGYMSQLGKLNSVIDRISRYGVCLVLLTTLLFFKYCVRLDLMSSILNDIRLICNGSIEHVPQKQSLRIYLAGLFIFVLNIQALYQGNLASLLTKPVSLPNINTLEDLANSHHTIYLHSSYVSFLKDSVFEGRYIELNTGNNGFAQAMHNSSACCLVDRYYMINEAVKNNMRLSSDTISKDYWVYQIRQDWPLEQRVNIIIQRLVEADLVTYWHMKHLQTTIERSKYYAKLDDEQQFKNITLDDLSFAFAILGIGLAIATAVFLVEFGFNSWYCNHI